MASRFELNVSIEKPVHNLTWVKTEVVVLSDLLQRELTIPPYQRPYKWQFQHVTQMLDDLIQNRSKENYRLGTVVLHADQATNIVDGQQRLLTLSLMTKVLDQHEKFRPKLLDHEFDSQVTIRQLKQNYAVIQRRTMQLSSGARAELLDFLLNRCQLICITLNDLGEAFQFFDSQNSRGKELEPYDLLKAFHLRQMESCIPQERIDCVTYWEDEVRRDTDKTAKNRLHVIIADILFPLRRWSQGLSGMTFNRSGIAAFKGLDLYATTYRFADPLRMIDTKVESFNNSSKLETSANQVSYPFLVDQTLINGKRFFEFIRHYSDLYQALFIDGNPRMSDVLYTINNYEGRNRVGDQYVRDLFFCTVLYYVDKFGDFELEKLAALCFLWTYRLRLKLQKIGIESIDNAALARGSLVHVIRHAINPHIVLTYIVPPLKTSDIRVKSKVAGLVKKFDELGNLHHV